MSATPRPWKQKAFPTGRVEIWGKQYIPEIKREVDAPVCKTYKSDGEDDNAELIVRAVNAHDDLVTALRDVLELVDRERKGFPCDYEYWQINVEQAKAALAKARGEA